MTATLENFAGILGTVASLIWGENNEKSVRIYTTYAVWLINQCNIFKTTEKSVVFWCSHRESNPELSLRRAPLYPFNYENIYSILQDIAIPTLVHFLHPGHQIGHQILF